MSTELRRAITAAVRVSLRIGRRSWLRSLRYDCLRGQRRPDEQRVLPDSMGLPEEQQARGIQRTPGRRHCFGFNHQARVGDAEFGHRPAERIYRRNARHIRSMTGRCVTCGPLQLRLVESRHRHDGCYCYEYRDLV
jgi:hypothetical protein